MPSKATLFLGVFVGALCSAEPINFSRQIRPILSENCIACHGPDEKARKGKLRLDDEKDSKRDRKGDFVILPGKPDQSELIKRIESTDPDDVMPPPKQHKTIPAAQVALLKEWIKQGAPWGRHWSYEPVARPSVPKNGEGNPVDAFLADRQKKEGLTWSPEAPKSILIRRLALDITGLPPTPEEVAKLSGAKHADIVAHFLAKPAYGEHWARQWLDLARYADSAGYPSDPGRVIWAYRDWVIKALNKNQPYDQFVIEQMAGDLLPKPTEDQLIATAFHRNTMTQNEGGTSDEEFRNAAVIDRVNTTYAVFMGTTMACAQCHTHKFDPIKQEDYYSLQAVFAGVDRAERPYDTDAAVYRKRRVLLDERRAVMVELQPLLDKAAAVTSPEIQELDKQLRVWRGEKATEKVAAGNAQRKQLVRALLDAATVGACCHSHAQ